MKKILNIIALGVFVALSVNSCKGFLEETNPTGLVNVAGTEALLEGNVTGIYSSAMWTATFLEKFAAAGGMFMYGKSGSSTCTSEDYTTAYAFTVYSTVGSNNDIYAAQYRPIHRANAFLSDILPLSNVDESYKKEIEAEVRFIRAVAYFNLVRIWGDVPMPTEQCTAITASDMGRTKYDRIYKYVVDELKYAAENMRSPARVREVTPTMPRPNKFAAVAYLQSVYLQIGNLLEHPNDNFWDTAKESRKPDFSDIGVNTAKDAFNKSLDYAQKLIPGSEAHDPECEYKLVDKYGELFNYDRAAVKTKEYDAWINPEEVFTYSTSQESVSCTWSRNTLPDYCPGTLGAKATNGNTQRTRPTRFVFQKWCETYPGEKGKAGAANANIYISSSDPRVDASFYYTTFVNGANKTIKPYPVDVACSTTANFPYLRKYWASNYVSTATDASVHYKRFAQVYLDAAEAAAYLGDHDLAKRYVGVVHARARHSVADGQPDSAQPNWDGKTFGTNDELIVAIYWEKIFELLGEGSMIELIDNHNKGSKWLADNIAKPLNDHIMLSEQKAFFSGEGKSNKMYSGAQRRIYVEDSAELRKSLLCVMPKQEYDYNAGLFPDNDFWWGR